jgi:excisionase family DNA binding protein
MSKKQIRTTEPLTVTQTLPLFMTPAQMSIFSGIGEGTLRTLIKENKIDYLQVGNRYLLSTESIMDYYHRNKVCFKVN